LNEFLNLRVLGRHEVFFAGHLYLLDLFDWLHQLFLLVQHDFPAKTT